MLKKFKILLKLFHTISNRPDESIYEVYHLNIIIIKLSLNPKH